MFDRDQDICDENKFEERELNCARTITVSSGASYDFMITKNRWWFQDAFWLTASIYPIDDSAHAIILDIKKQTLAFAKLFITLTVYKKYPEVHLTQQDFQVLWQLVDAAEFYMGTHTGYYIQEIKTITQNQSNWKSSFLVVPELKIHS